jgi:hypothetical protein
LNPSRPPNSTFLLLGHVFDNPQTNKSTSRQTYMSMNWNGGLTLQNVTTT